MTELTPERLASSIRGCFLGKNIGGTLGAPLEGLRETNTVDFYLQKDLQGNPEPNDDLDLQLVWLILVEYYGINHLTPRLMGEYWINNISGPWNEYGICHWNCKSGFYPPLSGSVDNEKWKWSNGAWIRSEIWACLFPGCPDEAIKYAYKDASCDHTAEGVYAELFTAALESAAFVEQDILELIQIGLSKIPDESRLRKSIDLVCDCFRLGDSWLEARNKVVQLNQDIGWFQAPGNVSFMVIGLLYGQGDFGKSICIATNCGDDTDCTAATAGAIMGIILGAENIPEKWTAPIGDRILTKSLNLFGLPLPIPQTVTELTRRIIVLQDLIVRTTPVTAVENLKSRQQAQELWQRSPFELQYDIGWAVIGIDYLNGPLIEPGKTYALKLVVHSPISSEPEFRFRWELPEGWSSSSSEVRCSGHPFCHSSINTELTAPDIIPDVMTYLKLEVCEDQRNFPQILTIPFRRKGAVSYPIYDGKTDPEEARKYCKQLLKRLKEITN